MTEPSAAESLINHTLQCTLRPKRNDRIDVILSVLNFVVDNYRQPQDDLDYGPAVIEVGDIENLIKDLKSLRS